MIIDRFTDPSGTGVGVSVDGGGVHAGVGVFVGPPGVGVHVGIGV
jgi:hypothetical protein